MYRDKNITVRGWKEVYMELENYFEALSERVKNEISKLCIKLLI
jgi:hypothetical protein